METEYDLDELLKGKVEAIIAKLSDLASAELEQLKKAEAAAVKPRQQLIDAIAAELNSRPVEASNEDIQSQAALDAQAAKIAALEGQLAERDRRIADLEAAIADAAGKGQAKAEKPVAMKPHAEAAEEPLPDELVVVCVDGDNATIPGLPKLTFAGWQFGKDGQGGYVLNEGIAFPRGVPETEVSALFAVTGKGKGLRGGLVSPLIVGGGKSVEIPAGHLRFA